MHPITLEVESSVYTVPLTRTVGICRKAYFSIHHLALGGGVRGAVLALNGAVKYRYDGDQAKDSASWGYVQGFLRTIFLKLGGFTQRAPSFLAFFQWRKFLKVTDDSLLPPLTPHQVFNTDDLVPGALLAHGEGRS